MGTGVSQQQGFLLPSWAWRQMVSRAWIIRQHRHLPQQIGVISARWSPATMDGYAAKPPGLVAPTAGEIHRRWTAGRRC